MKKIVGILLLAVLPQSWAMNLNVAIAMEDDRLTRALKQWINTAKQTPLFEKYGFQWFVGHYPLHVTLYQAAFSKNNYSILKKSAQKLAQEADAFCVSTGALSLTASGWIMMDVQRNDALQSLSDKAVIHLSASRDTQASIPSWAGRFPGKKKAFARYGSPNVFFEFEPHLSLSGPPSQKIDAEDRLRIMRYLAEHPIPTECWPVTTIVLGQVNRWGQITKERAHYSL